MQNSFGPRNAAMFCISTKTAPSAKPWQKLTAAVPVALSGAAVQSSTKSPVVRAPKLASVAAYPARGVNSTTAATAVHPFNVITAFPSFSEATIVDQSNNGQRHLERTESRTECDYHYERDDRADDCRHDDVEVAFAVRRPADREDGYDGPVLRQTV